MNCPNCHQADLESSDLFCPNCGVDLQSYMKVQKYNTPKIDMVSHFTSPQAGALRLTAQTITEYKNLTQEINDLEDIPQKLARNQQQLQFMESKLSQNEQLLTNLTVQSKKEKHDVDKLTSLSVTSLIAKIKGDKEQKMKKEEAEYLAVMNRLEALNTDISAQKNEINTVSKHIADLKNLNVRLQQNREALTKLINQTTQGVPDPVEDKIELEMENLNKQYDPLQAHLNNRQQVFQYLDSAYADLNFAYDQIHSASNYANWDMFFGGGMFVDAIKHSKMSNARDIVNRAHRSIDLARNLDPNIPGIGAFVDDISWFWDGFFDNIFTDWASMNKINQSMTSVASALNQLDTVRTRVHNDINRGQGELQTLNSRVVTTREKLLHERTRMIEDAIKLQAP